MRLFRFLRKKKTFFYHIFRLRSLPRDVFHATIVDTVNLSFNEFVAMPTSALTEVAASLRSLDLSFNAIEHLDSTMFANTPRLLSLSLANNRLTILPENIFIGLNSLRTLDLSSNPIRANYPELLTYVQRLSVLKLADVEMTNLPSIPLKNLIHFDLSGNRLTDVPFLSAEGIPNLKHLNLSRNQVSYNVKYIFCRRRALQLFAKCCQLLQFLILSS